MGELAGGNLTCNITIPGYKNTSNQGLAERLYLSDRPGAWDITSVRSEFAAYTYEVTSAVGVDFTQVIPCEEILLLRLVEQVDAFQ